MVFWWWRAAWLGSFFVFRGAAFCASCLVWVFPQKWQAVVLCVNSIAQHLYKDVYRRVGWVDVVGGALVCVQGSLFVCAAVRPVRRLCVCVLCLCYAWAQEIHMCFSRTPFLSVTHATLSPFLSIFVISCARQN